jgi:hypothetical protein
MMNHEVLIWGGVSDLAHGVVVGFERKRFEREFVMVRLYTREGKRAQTRQTLVPRSRVVSFGILPKAPPGIRITKACVSEWVASRTLPGVLNRNEGGRFAATGKPSKRNKTEVATFVCGDTA